MKKTLLSALKHGSGTIFILLAMILGNRCGLYADNSYNYYVYSTDNNMWVYAWYSNSGNVELLGSWRGEQLQTSSDYYLGNNWWKFTFDIPVSGYNVIINQDTKTQSDDLNYSASKFVKTYLDGNTCKVDDYGTASDYKTVKSGGLLDNRLFSSFDESKQAFKYELSNISAGTYFYKVHKGDTEYWSTINNTRGNVTLSGGKSGSTNNDVSFTLSGGNKNITIYYDPGADVTFVDAVEACTTPTVGAVSGDVATEECEGTVELSVSPTGGTEPLSYQWFKNNTQSTSGGTAVTGKTSSNTYTPLSGSYYYYCEVYSAGECEATYHASSSPTTNRVNIKDAPVVTASATVITNYTPVVVSAAGPNVVWTKDVKSGTDENSYLYKPTNSSVIFKGKGTSGTVVYTVTGTAENGCSSSVDISVSQDVDICQ